MLKGAARFLIAVALLAAQQTAIAHEIWHLGEQDSQPAQSQLCEEHHALATVAGALDCASPDSPLVATRDAPLAFLARPAAPAPRVVPASRGPPKPLS